MTLPGDSSFELNAESFIGGISTDFAVTMTRRISEGHGPQRDVRGTVGNGGASVRLKTFSGSVSLKKK